MVRWGFYTRRVMTHLPSTYAPVDSAFHVHAGGSGQIFGTGSYVPVSWTTEVYDAGDEFSSNVFTPKVSGKYMFRASLLFNSSENGTLGIMVNNIPVVQRKNTGDLYIISSIVELNVGDAVHLAFNRTSGGDGTIAGFAFASNFKGYLVYEGTG